MNDQVVCCYLCGGTSWEDATFSQKIEVRGVEIDVTNLEGLRCLSCGELLQLPHHIRRNEAAFAEERRRALSKTLLRPERIRTIRENLGITQQEAARYFGGGVNAFSKYERGVVTQSEAMDRLVRLVGMYPSMLDHLKEWSGESRKPPAASTRPWPFAQQHLEANTKPIPVISSKNHEMEGEWRRQA